MGLLSNVFRPVVADAAGVRKYVVSVTLYAWIVALGVDVPNQLTFSSNWPDCWREWAFTSLLVVGIAVPIARSIGRAHLALHKARREAERLSLTDPLTGLANRRAFYEAVRLRPDGALVLVIADIDRFKRINDRYGHAAGDEVIKAVATMMQEELGDLGTVARLGGEEFALVAAYRPSGEFIARLQQFRQRVADEAVPAAGQALHATISVGVAVRGDLDFDGLYAAADTALYVAKSAGRDRVVDFDEIDAIAPTAKEALLRAS